LNKSDVILYVQEDDVAALASDFELAMDLISRSLCEKTSAHMQSIEARLQRAAIARNSAQRFLDEAWPHIRARLMFYHDSRA